MSGPRVTSLVTAYNYGRFIEATLESVLAQGLPPERHEVLVVDNGSTDDTRARVARFGDRVRYHYQDNFQGQAGTLNTGFRLARGEVVCLLDADDMWVPEKLARVLEAFDADPELGIVQHGSRYVGPVGEDLGVAALPTGPARLSIDDLRSGPVYNAHISSLCLTRRVLERIGPVPAAFAASLPDAYLVQHGLFFAPVASLRLPLTLYRRHGRSWSDRWGAARAEPRDLALGHRTQRAFDGHLRRRLRERGVRLSWPREAVLRARRERVERLVLLSAYAGRHRRALRLVAGLWPLRRSTAEGVFKAATLALAAAAPMAYAAAYRAYHARPWVAAALGRVDASDPFLVGR